MDPTPANSEKGRAFRFQDDSRFVPFEVRAGFVWLCQDRPHVMVIDLGVAQISQACKDGDPCGTPATMAPEVCCTCCTAVLPERGSVRTVGSKNSAWALLHRAN
eukprot:5708315-Amphidinium_carterae.1